MNLRFTIYDLRGRVAALASLLLCAFALTARATPFYFQGFNSVSNAITSQIGVTFWPPTDRPWTVYGTNIIYGGNILTITPNSSGFSSNWMFPGTYQFIDTNLNAAFIATIPDTTNYQSLALYVINQPVFSGISMNSYQLLTNLLGFAPASNSLSGITSALGYTPPTNSYSGLTNALGLAPATNNTSGITFALGYIPPTNTFSGLTNALGYTPPTNSYSGLTNALGLAPATNSTLGIEAALGYTPPTNTYAGITNALGFGPPTNNTTGIEAALAFTPQTNYVGHSSGASLFTNGLAILVVWPTNAVPGTAFTNLPQGSLMTTTNGAFFVLSNLVWNPK